MRSRLELRASTFGDPRELGKQLRDADAILPEDKEELRKLLEAIAKVIPRKRMTVLARSGWLKNFQGFCVGDRILGKAPEGAMPPSKRNGKSASGTRLRVRGSAGDWRQKVSGLARESNLLLFMMSIPFAAPLLRRRRQGSFGIVISGRTRIGKTFASLAAASAQGIGRAKDMMTWSMSDPRLEELLPRWNDLMTPIDDFMTMSGTQTDKVGRIDNFAYRLATGREYDRHSSFKGSDEAGEYSTILLTQNEDSVTEMSVCLRQQRKAGAAQRLIDLPALDGDQFDIFDLYAKREKARPTSEWQAHFFELLNERCCLYHGAAFDAYMRALIADGKDAITAARADQNAFIKEVIDPLDGAEAHDLAMKFGIIFAGSCRAVEYGIVSWSREGALAAAKVCYRRARALLRDDGLLIQDELERLRGALIALPVVRVGAVKRKQPDKAIGFRERDKDIRRCVIAVEALARHFTSTRQQQLVLRWCAENARLTLAKVKNERDGLCQKEQFFWPDGRRKRSYEFKIPVSAHI